MKLKKAIKVLKFHNYFRNSNTEYLKPVYSEKEVTEAIDSVLNVLEELKKQLK